MVNRFILTFGLTLFIGYIQAQGVERILVEKYYVSDTTDSKAVKGGYLPPGSVTYRIYVDMLPRYRFQAAYGIAGHELRIATTTLFFNNEDQGATTANEISKDELKNNTVMLDSWLSVGAASSGNFGILKADDNGTETIVNGETPQLLQHDDPLAGIPLKVQDGLLARPLQSVVSTFGIENEIRIFDKQNDGTNGPVFSTYNGSWASFGGAIGPDTNNRVLIAQITTNGALSFKLNLQIETPQGGVENYVAENPTGNEFQIPSLIYPELQPVTEIRNDERATRGNKAGKTR